MQKDEKPEKTLLPVNIWPPWRRGKPPQKWGSPAFTAGETAVGAAIPDSSVILAAIVLGPSLLEAATVGIAGDGTIPLRADGGSRP